MQGSLASKLLLIDEQTWRNRQSIDFSKVLVLKIASVLGSLILLAKTLPLVLSGRAMDMNSKIQLVLLLIMVLIHTSFRNQRTVKTGSLLLILSLATALTLMLIASPAKLQAAAYHYVPGLFLFAGFQVNLRAVFVLFVHFCLLYLAIGFHIIGLDSLTEGIYAETTAINIDRLAEWSIIVLFIGLYHRLKNRQYKIISEHERNYSHREKLLSISRMAAGIAHEINNPLAIVSGYVEIMAKGDTSKPLDPKVFPRILEACDRIAVIVKGIVELSQDKFNQTESIQLAENMQSHLAEIAKTPAFSQVASRIKKLNFELKMPSGVWDPVVKAVVQNAFEAAIQQSSPQVDISFELDENGLSVVIADNGPEFDERMIKQFFEPFYTSKFDSHGRGMGLTIAHVLATRMGWSIHIKREGPWTRAHITIPHASLNSNQTLLPEVS